MLVDTHCHLYLHQFNNDLPRVYENAIANGIEEFVVPGINYKTSLEAIQLAEKYPGMYAAVGIHPNEAISWTENQYQDLLALSNHPKVIAIGEIGLDYYREYSPVELQHMVFKKQLELAMQVSKPIIIHCRNAFSDLWNILIQFENSTVKEAGNLNGVFHSFSGTLDNALSIIEKGFKIGICGPVTYKSAVELQDVVTKISLEHILVETDSPYLPPVPYRGKRNEPAMLVETVKKLANQKNIMYEEVAYQTTMNAANLFGLGA